MEARHKKRADGIPAVVLGMTANGLAVARSLGRKGIPVLGVGASLSEPGLYCRFLRAKHIAPDVQDEKKFLDFLITLGKGLDRPGVLLLTADEYLLFCSRYREQLSDHYVFNLPSQETVECFLDKEKTHEFAQRNGIRHPGTAVVSSEQAVKELAGRMEYPCIFKPRESHIWRRDFEERKVIVIQSPEELLEAYQGLGTHAAKVILQEIIPGPDDNIYQYLAYCNKDAEILAEFSCHKLRQYPPHFGIACLCESRREPRVVEQGRLLLSKIDAKGIFAIEYKLDERGGGPVFIEANLRTSFFGELPISCGVDFPYLIYRNLSDAQDLPCAHRFEEGVRLWNLALDLGCYFRLRRSRQTTFLKWLRMLKGKKIVHTYLAMDDLKPWAFVYWRLAGQIFKRALWRILGIRKRGTKDKQGLQ